MSPYATTVVAGFEEVAKAELKRRFADVLFRRVDTGILVYDTARPPQEVAQLPFANNSFAIITFAEGVPQAEPLGTIIQAARNDPALPQVLAALAPRGKRRYALKVSIANQPESIPHFLKEKLHKTLQEYGLIAKQTEPDIELWLFSRREGYGFFGLRLPKTFASDRPPAKGELKPELAALLCLLSDPQPADRFLDPCAGHGAIVFARARWGAAAGITAGDSDAALCVELERRAHEQGIPMRVREMDAETLAGIADASVDAVVTDPPWGLFQERRMDYGALLHALARVTVPGGRIVLLLGREILLEDLLRARPELSLARRYDVLVSGQKATAYRLNRH